MWFPPHLIYVLHYLAKLEMLITHVLHWVVRKKLQLTVDCGLQIRQMWNQLITTCWKYYKRRCTKHAKLIWTYPRRHWRMAAAMTTWSSLALSVLSRCFWLVAVKLDKCYHQFIRDNHKTHLSSNSKSYDQNIHIYRVGQKTRAFLKVYNSYIWWRRKALNISKCSAIYQEYGLSLIHIWRCRRSTLCRSRWSPYH